MKRWMCMLIHFSCVPPFVILWTVARQAPLSIGFSRQEYLVGCHALLQGIFVIQGWNSCLLTAGRFLTCWAIRDAPWKDMEETKCILLRKRSQSEKATYYIITTMWHATKMPDYREFLRQGKYCISAVPNLLGTREGPVLLKTIFPRTKGWRRGGVVSGWFKCITFIVHFISVIITSAPPQTIRHQIPEAGDPCHIWYYNGVCKYIYIYIYVFIHLSKMVEYTSSRLNHNVNYGLQMITMHQCRFISCNICTV